MSDPANPAQAGPFTFTSVVYAAAGLNYAHEAVLDYAVYHQPTAGFATRSIDLSILADFHFGFPWPFDNTDAPINGIARIPDGNGPFPVVLFAHGNHTPIEHSTPGYLYLCELLASHGIIAATVDINFLNGNNRGENDARAIVHLEHAKQFRIWNHTPGHPLEGRVDISRLMLVGHSRGGEAVGHASIFNRLASLQPDPQSPPIPLDGSEGLGPYNFRLGGVVAIAPTDQQFIPPSGPTRVRDNYFVFHGSRDADVYNFPGYLTYDRSHAVNLANPTAQSTGFKALLWIQGANHNFFNSVWKQESDNTISRQEQEQIARVYISALAQAILLGRPEYLELFKNHNLGIRAGWLPAGVSFVSQFQSPRRLFLQHFEESGTVLAVSSPSSGRVDASEVAASKLRFNLGAGSHLFQETTGVQLTWNGQGSRYRIEFTPQPLRTSGFATIALRVGQSFEPQNVAGQDQDFTLRFEDGTSAVTLTASLLHRLVFPTPGRSPDRRIIPDPEPKTVLQTLRIPLDRLQGDGLDTSRIVAIELIFDRTQRGRIYFDELQLTD
jgi:hypothetical protein